MALDAHVPQIAVKGMRELTGTRYDVAPKLTVPRSRFDDPKGMGAV